METRATKKRKLDTGKDTPKAALVNSSLQAQIAELEKLNQLQVEDLNRIISEKEAELDQLREKLCTNENKLDDATVELQALRAVYDEQQQLVADLRVGARLSNAILKATRLVDQRTHFDQLTHHTSRIEYLQEQIRVLQQQRKDIEEENVYRAAAQLFDERTIAQRESDLAEQREEIKLLNRELDLLRNKLAFLEQGNAETSEDFARELKLEKTRARELQEYVDELKMDNRYDDMVIKLNNIMESAKNESKEKEEAMRHELASLSTDLRDAQRELNDAKSQLSITQRAFEAKLAEAAKLKVSLIESQFLCDSLKREVDQMNNVVEFERTISAATMRAAKVGSAPQQLSRTDLPDRSYFFSWLFYDRLDTNVIVTFEYSEIKSDLESTGKEILSYLRDQVESKDALIAEQAEEIANLKRQLNDEKKRNEQLLESKNEQSEMLKPLYERQRNASPGSSPYRGYGAMPSVSNSPGAKRTLPNRVSSVRDVVIDASAAEAHDNSSLSSQKSLGSIARRSSSRLAQISVTPRAGSKSAK